MMCAGSSLLLGRPAERREPSLLLWLTPLDDDVLVRKRQRKKRVRTQNVVSTIQLKQNDMQRVKKA